MESPLAYIPMDRRQALARGDSLPERTTGAVLFADISGFTPLTETLQQEYGPRRGAEELTRQLNQIYEALVSEVHRYGGSVLAFSGDAITCWLDGDDGLRATACALAMQQQMGQFAAIETRSGQTIALAMKAAVAVGAVRRFLIGQATIQYIDTMAGDTLDQVAAAEHHAEKGEVVVTAQVIDQVGAKLEISERRGETESETEQYGVVAAIRAPHHVTPTPWPPLDTDQLAEDVTRPWLLPPIYERLHTGKGEFLAELRPAVTMFLYFNGIDYDRDEAAGEKLDGYIRWVQTVLARYDAYLFQLTIGDKGSYLYTAFGAPVAHEDDAVRAVSAALDLVSPPPSLDFITETQIGISQGRLYTGAYGGQARRTYGVLGDEVNLSARLMQKAGPGQILVSQAARQNSGDLFQWEELPPFKVKGKSRPITAFKPLGRQTRHTIHLQEPEYTLPMVGRQAELQLVRDRVAEAKAGRGQFIGLTAEAGMGKSRLVAEIIRLAGEAGLTGYGGECQSYGRNISYLVWQPIWRSFFGLDPAWEVERQIVELEAALERIDPALLPRLPLLGAVLNITIPDNDLTKSFDAKLRKTSLESLLVDCLRTRATNTPLFLVLEDCHWLDNLSIELLEVIGQAISDLPVLVILAYRPPELQHLSPPWTMLLPAFTEIALTHFEPAEAEQLIQLKLAHFAETDGAIPADFIQRVTERAQGNPFYIEELLNYLHDRGIDPQDSQALEKLDLPDSLHSLVLSRIDQLGEAQKITLKVASVIGRLFQTALLFGMYPELGEEARVRTSLESLTHMELTALETPDPELTYLFRHVMTQEVAYESLPYALRSILHEQLADYLESHYAETLDQYIDLLAYHYDRSDNTPKKQEYLRKAGEAAQAEYANDAAIDYYRRVLPLLPPTEKIAIMRRLGDVLQLVGQWTEADQMYHQALGLAEQTDDRSAQAWCEVAISELFRKQGQYAEAATWLERAKTTFESLGDQVGLGQVLHNGGTLAAQQGDYATAQARYQQSLAIRRTLDDKPNIASLLNNLAIIAEYAGDYAASRQLNEESLALRQEVGDKLAIANSLNNLGNVILSQGDYDQARTRLEAATVLRRAVGDRWAIANSLNNLGNVIRAQGDYPAAAALYRESLTINKTLGDQWAIAYLLEDIGSLAALEGQAERALHLVGAAETLRESIGAPLPPAEQEKLETTLAPARNALGDTAETILAEGRTLSLEQALEMALT